jgi:hypothetical protein
MQCTGQDHRVYAALKQGVSAENARYTVHLSGSANQVDVKSRLQITNAPSKQMNAFLNNKKQWIRASPRSAPLTWESEHAAYTLPVVVKGDTGNNGEQVWKCDTHDQVHATIEYGRQQWKHKWQYHLQQYIGNGTVVRAYVVFMKSGGVYVWNTGLLKPPAETASVSISIDNAPWKQDFMEKCLAIARQLPWGSVHKDVMGVWVGLDVVANDFTESNVAYVIDINPGASLALNDNDDRTRCILSMVESLPALREGWLHLQQSGSADWGVHAATTTLTYMRAHGNNTWSFPDLAGHSNCKLWVSLPESDHSVAHVAKTLFAAQLQFPSISLHCWGARMTGMHN